MKQYGTKTYRRELSNYHAIFLFGTLTKEQYKEGYLLLLENNYNEDDNDYNRKC